MLPDAGVEHDPTDHTALAAALQDLAPRQLFLVEQHDLGVRKRLFGGYAGVGRRPGKHTSYSEVFWAFDCVGLRDPEA